MKTTHLKLPNGRTIECHIRLSKRAKYMRMQLSVDKGLVVTQPIGVCEHVLHDWIASQSAWLSEKLDQLQQMPTLNQHGLPALPQHMVLPILDQTLHIDYIKTPSRQIVTDYTDDQLTLSGTVDNQAFCLYVLQQWLHGYAKDTLRKALDNLARETGFRYNQCRIKNQKTRWGSCSAKGNINLNYKLLLMPKHWARYTLIHELCHTVELNHSKKFWAQVQTFVPDYPSIHKEMQQAQQTLPAWVNYDDQAR